MEFTPEDGNGLGNANALADVSEADDYFELRQVEDWAEASETAKKRALVVATDYIEGRWSGRFLGYQLRAGQALSFPRRALSNSAGRPITGVPDDFKRGVFEYALRVIKGINLQPDPTYDESGKTATESTTKIGPLTFGKKFLDRSTRPKYKSYPAADQWIERYTVPAGRVIR